MVVLAMLPTAVQTILAAVSLILVVRAQQTCYSINGNPDTKMSPCNASAANSGCCYANEYCLTNGLCINQALVGGNRLSRVGCTDKTWEDPACFQECKTGTFGPNGLQPWTDNGRTQVSETAA